MANQILYGFFNMKDLFTRRVTEVGVSVVNAAIDASVAEHNRQMDAFLNLFAQPTTDFKKRYLTSAIARLQPLDADGRSRPIKPSGFYDVSWPIQMAGGAWGANYVTRAKMTVSEANEATNVLVSADYRWIRDHILAALYANVSWSFSDDLHGALTIKGPANADTDTYLIQAGADAAATDNHFLAQAAAIADATNPYPTIYDELVEHPENTGEVISFIPTNLRATTEALATFKESPDPNIRSGANTDLLIGALGVSIPGKLVGYADKNWIAEWKALPDNYIVSIMSGGERPLGMRQDPEGELQGFQRVAERNDHPFYESQYLRRAGFGAWNRVGVVVTRIGNASYAIPTGYTSPMP